ncbi:unnamed protein product [Brugia timori]|uniref:Uncharacterized protein n=1 Tax=Brugia timori TaxID=42155 RepID=A0A3P7TS95_9BILA|nr:unnamed protein product [Brugia timori]
MITALIYAPYRVTLKRFLFSIPDRNHPLYSCRDNHTDYSYTWVSNRRSRGCRESEITLGREMVNLNLKAEIEKYVNTNSEKIQRVEKYNGKHNILAINDDVQANDSYDTQRQFKDQEEKEKKTTTVSSTSSTDSTTERYKRSNFSIRMLHAVDELKDGGRARLGRVRGKRTTTGFNYPSLR